MKKSLSILSVALVALSLTSCGSSDQAESEQSQQSPTAQAPAPSPSPNATKPKAQASSRSSVSGLIPSTDPKQRRQKIEQGRKDPFAFVPVKPQQKIQPVPSQPQSPPTSNGPQPNSSSPVPPSVSSRRRPSQPALPPQPELAKAVAIAGIIDIGGVTQIIVKAPGERTSRYVRPGDYLANGQVLVKRVENAQSPTPVVVLEELGQEVYKEVGEGVASNPSETEPSQERIAFSKEVFPGGI
jgi:hypothetical protein